MQFEDIKKESNPKTPGTEVPSNPENEPANGHAPHRWCRAPFTATLKISDTVRVRDRDRLTRLPCEIPETTRMMMPLGLFERSFDTNSSLFRDSYTDIEMCLLRCMTNKGDAHVLDNRDYNFLAYMRIHLALFASLYCNRDFDPTEFPTDLIFIDKDTELIRTSKSMCDQIRRLIPTDNGTVDTKFTSYDLPIYRSSKRQFFEVSPADWDEATYYTAEETYGSYLVPDSVYLSFLTSEDQRFINAFPSCELYGFYVNDRDIYILLRVQYSRLADTFNVNMLKCHQILTDKGVIVLDRDNCEHFTSEDFEHLEDLSSDFDHLPEYEDFNTFWTYHDIVNIKTFTVPIIPHALFRAIRNIYDDHRYMIGENFTLPIRKIPDLYQLTRSKVLSYVKRTQ